MHRDGVALAALAAIVGAALAYFLLASELPAFEDLELNAFASGAAALVLLSAIIAAALPLRASYELTGLLLLAGAGAGVALTAASELEASSPFKALAAAGLGFTIGRFMFSPLPVYVLAIFVALVDVGSVAAGPARYLIEDQPPIVDYVTLLLPEWGGLDAIQLGISDLLFLAVYLDVAWRFGLRRRVTAVALASSLVASLGLAVWLDAAIPALPLLSLALLLPNADRVWSSFRAALHR